MSTIQGGGLIVTSGITFYLDSANPNSYVGTGTTWNDIGSIDYQGVLTNSPTYSTLNKGNFIFDGINDYVSTNYLTPFSTNSLTIGMWFKFSATQLSSLFSKRIGAGGGFQQLSLFISNDVFGNSLGTKLVVNDFSAGTGRLGITTKSFNDGKWHYCVLVRNSLNVRIFVDGILELTSSSAIPNLSNPYRLFIGCLGDNLVPVGFYFNGNISMFQLYNRELSTTEITQNYNVAKFRFNY